MYTDETLFRVNGEFVINDETVVYDMPGESEGRKFLFYVSTKGAATLDDVLCLSAQSQRDKVEWMEAIADAKHSGFKLVNQPELWLDAFYPSIDLAVSYDQNSIFVEYGNMLKPSMTELPPSVTLRLADEKSIYSLIMIDLDSIHANAESKTVYLHWAVINIVGSNISTGVEVASYQGPAPEFDSGLHRFFFIVFNQNFVLTSGQADEMRDSYQHREQFSYLDWMRTRNLGDPVGLNGFFAGWEEYCKELHQKRGYVPPQDYLLRRQDAYLRREAEAILVEDTKMALYRSLTLSDLFPPSVDISIPAAVGSLALCVSYDGAVVSGGAQLLPEAVQEAPSVSFTPHQAEICGFTAGTNTIAVDFGLYTLLMIDLDMPASATDSGSGKSHSSGHNSKPIEEVHWVVINIPQSNIDEGVEIVPYNGPAPEEGTGLHRYAFCLYKQKKAFNVQQIDATRAFFAKRLAGVKSYDWVRSHGAVLLNVPVGLEAFLCGFDATARDAAFEKHKVSKSRQPSTPSGIESAQDDTSGSTSAASKSNPPAVRTSFGSVLLDDEHGFFEAAPGPAPFSFVKAAAAPNDTEKSTSDKTVDQLPAAVVAEEDRTRHLDRTASQAVEVSDIPIADTKVLTAEFSPKAAPATRSSRAPEESPVVESKGKSDKRDKKAELDPIAQLKEERLRADKRVLEERRRISKQQEDEAELMQEEKRKKAQVEAEKLRKQEELRRAMQEHEQAEAERVRLYEARVQAERQKNVLEQAEELRRLEQRQQEEVRRVIQRQQREEAAVLERQQQLEARLLEDKRRQKEQRMQEEANQLRLFEAQQLQEKRRPKLLLRSKSEEADYYDQQDYPRNRELDERAQYFRQREEDERRGIYSPRSAHNSSSNNTPRSAHSGSQNNTPRSSKSFDGYDMTVPPLPTSQNRFPSYASHGSSDVSLDLSVLSAEYENESLASSKQPRSVSFEDETGERRLVKERQRREQEILRRQRQAEEEYQIQYLEQQRMQQLRDEEAQRRSRAESSPPGPKRQASFKMEQQRLEDERLAREYYEEDMRRQGDAAFVKRQSPVRDAQRLEEERVRREMDEEQARRARAEDRRSPGTKRGEQQLLEDERIARELHEQELRIQRSPQMNEPIKRKSSFKRDQFAEEERLRWEQEEEQKLRQQQQLQLQQQAYEEERARREYEEEQIRRQRALELQQQQKQQQQLLEDERIARELHEEEMRRPRPPDMRESPRMQPPTLKRVQAQSQPLQPPLPPIQQQDEDRTRAEREERDRIAKARREQEEREREEQLRRMQQEQLEREQQVRYEQEEREREERARRIQQEQLEREQQARWEQEEREREEQVRRLQQERLEREQQQMRWEQEERDREDQARRIQQQEELEREQQARWEQEEREEQEREEARRLAEEQEYEEEMRLLHLQLEEETLDGTVEPYDEKDDFSVPVFHPEELAQRTPPTAYAPEPFDQSRDRESSSKPRTDVSLMQGDRSRESPSTSPLRPREDGRGGRERDREPPSGPATRPLDMNNNARINTEPVERRHSQDRDEREFKSDEPTPSTIPPRSPDSSAARKRVESSPGISSAGVARRVSGDKVTSSSALQKQQRLLEEGLAVARSTPDVCVAFGVLSKGIFDGEKLRKKFSSDYMFKETFVWIDPHRRSFHWGKVALDAPNSKYIIVDPSVGAPATLPDHLRAAGEFKGVCKDAELVDAVTFRLVLTTGKLFEAKAPDADKAADWMKVLTSTLQRRPMTSN